MIEFLAASKASWMRSIELFTGAGGLALGLQRAGFESVLMVEWDDDAFETVKANAASDGPTHGWPIHHGDVRDMNFTDFREIDLVAGGPPCQPFSIGGKHGGFNDPRDMWPQAVRAVRELSPKAFLFENVGGLARPAFAAYLNYIVERLRRPSLACKPGETWHEHLERLTHLSIGKFEGPTYRVEVHKVNAAGYGAPQKRHRLIVVGLRTDLSIEWKFPRVTHSRETLIWEQHVTGSYWRRHKIPFGLQPTPSSVDLTVADDLVSLLGAPKTTKAWLTVRDTIADLPDPHLFPNQKIANHRLQAGARSYVGHTGSVLDEPAKALKAGVHGVPGGENMVVRPDGSVRYFTVREAARLQGFPDNFVFPGSWTESMRQLGNAVPVPLAMTVASSLAKALQSTKRTSNERRAA